MAKTDNSTEMPATLDQMASLNFEPWKHEEGEWTPPSDEEWARLANPYLVTVRIAWLVMHKSKPELIEMLDALEDDAGHDMKDRFIGTIEWFKGMLAILEGAEARILCAGAVVAMRTEG